MTKEEILDKWLERYGLHMADIAHGTTVIPYLLHEAMVEYAKQQTVAFSEWVIDPDNEYSRTGLNQWTHFKTLENINTEELYSIFLFTFFNNKKCQPLN